MTNMRKFILICTVSALMLSACSVQQSPPASGAGGSAPSQLQIGLRISTTSDWTTVAVAGATLSDAKVVSSSPEATHAAFDEAAARFDLNQPLERAGGSAVELTAQVSLSNFVGSSLTVTIDRGGIGATQVQIYRLAAGQPVLVQTFDWADTKSGGVPNAEVFTISLASLSGGRPAAAAGAPPAAPSSAAPTGTVVAPVRLVVVTATNSDWTTVSFSGASLSESKTTFTSPEASDAGFDEGQARLNLSQPLDRAGGDPVIMITETTLSGISEAGPNVTIDRGGIGLTRVELFRIEGDQSALVSTLTWQDANPAGTPNTKTFNVKVAALLRPLPPKPAAAGGELRIALQVSTTSDWTTVKVGGGALTNVKIPSSSPEATKASFDEGALQFALNQPIEKAGKWSVDMTAEGLLAVQPSSTITLTIDRGGIGSTTVQVLRFDGDRQVRVKTLAWGTDQTAGQGTSKSFEIPGSVFLGLESHTAAPTVRVPAPGEVIIPDTTKALDSALRQNLQSMGQDGTLYFAKSTPLLESLVPGDVLVSDVSPAAPHGILRKVRAVRSEGGGVVVETEAALLTDAISQGSGSVDVELSPSDVVSADLLQPGPHEISYTQKRPPAADIEFPFELPTIKYDFGPAKNVHLEGGLKFNTRLHAKLNIRCGKIVTDPVFGTGDHCIWPGGASFEASLTVTEIAHFSANAQAGAPFASEPISIKDYTITHIVIPILFIVVVLEPTLSVSIRSNASIGANLSYGIEQNLTLVAGFSCDTGSGCQNLSHATPGFNQTGPTFEGEANLSAYLRLGLSLLLYGSAGPEGILEAGVEMRGNKAGLADARNLDWKMDGCFNIGLVIRVDVLWIDKTWPLKTYTKCLWSKKGENERPTVTITMPGDGATWKEGSHSLQSIVSDPEQQPMKRCTWTSTGGSDVLSDTSCGGATVALKGSGAHTFTLTAIDSADKEGHDSVTVHVPEASVLPPVAPAFKVTILSPANGARMFPCDPTTLQASADGGVPPYSFGWSLIYPIDPDGNRLPGHKLYDLGNGEILQWKPSDTVPFESCNQDAWGLLQLLASDGAGSVAPAQPVVIHFFRLQ